MDCSVFSWIICWRCLNTGIHCWLYYSEPNYHTSGIIVFGTAWANPITANIYISVCLSVYLSVSVYLSIYLYVYTYIGSSHCGLLIAGNPALNDHSLQLNQVKPHNIIFGCEPIIHYNLICWLGLFNAHERPYLLCNISLAPIEQRSKSLLIDYYSGLYYSIYWGLSSSIITVSINQPV